MPENTVIQKLIGDQDLPNIPLDELIDDDKDKPFNECLRCEYLGNGCRGPNLGAMTLARTFDFLQLRRLQLKYSYQKVATLCGIHSVTVVRNLRGQVKEPSFATIQALSDALISDPTGKHPCAKHLTSKEKEQLMADCQAAKDELARKEAEFHRLLEEERRKVEYLREQDKFKEKQLLEKDKQIDAQEKRLEERRDFIYRKDRIIAILGISLAVCLLLIIGALLVDSINPNIGFFWLDKLAAAFGGGGIASAVLDEATHFLI